MSSWGSLKNFITTAVTTVATNTTILLNQLDSSRHTPDEDLLPSHSLHLVDSRSQNDMLGHFNKVVKILDDISECPEFEPQHQKAIKENLKLCLRHLEHESNLWIKNYKSRPDPKSEDLPCLFTFLESSALQGLCSRAEQDSPSGTLILVLIFLKQLLSTIKYPLLSHNTIYKPISRIISTLTKRDLSSPSLPLNLPEEKRIQLIQAKNRLDLALIGLLIEVWSKVMANPHLIERFVCLPNSLSSPPSVSFDILSLLLTRVLRPLSIRTTHLSRTLLLSALSLHHPSIDSYILYHSPSPFPTSSSLSGPQSVPTPRRFLEGLVEDLCKYYQSAVGEELTRIEEEKKAARMINSQKQQQHHQVSQSEKLLIPFLPPLPPSTSHSPSLSSPTSNLDCFLSSLRFVMGMIEVASPFPPGPLLPQDQSISHSSSSSPRSGPSIPRTPLSMLLDLLWRDLLQGRVRPGVRGSMRGGSMGGEEVVAASQEMLRRILLEARVSSPLLLSLISHFLLGGGRRACLHALLQSRRGRGSNSEGETKSYPSLPSTPSSPSPSSSSLQLYQQELARDQEKDTGFADFLPLLISRIGAIMKPLSISSLRLLSSLLLSSPLLKLHYTLVHSLPQTLSSPSTPRTPSSPPPSLSISSSSSSSSSLLPGCPPHEGMVPMTMTMTMEIARDTTEGGAAEREGEGEGGDDIPVPESLDTRLSVFCQVFFIRPFSLPLPSSDPIPPSSSPSSISTTLPSSSSTSSSSHPFPLDWSFSPLERETFLLSSSRDILARLSALGGVEEEYTPTALSGTSTSSPSLFASQSLSFGPDTTTPIPLPLSLPPSTAPHSSSSISSTPSDSKKRESGAGYGLVREGSLVSLVRFMDWEGGRREGLVTEEEEEEVEKGEGDGDGEGEYKSQFSPYPSSPPPSSSYSSPLSPLPSLTHPHTSSPSSSSSTHILSSTSSLVLSSLLFQLSQFSSLSLPEQILLTQAIQECTTALCAMTISLSCPPSSSSSSLPYSRSANLSRLNSLVSIVRGVAKAWKQVSISLIKSHPSHLPSHLSPSHLSPSHLSPSHATPSSSSSSSSVIVSSTSTSSSSSSPSVYSHLLSSLLSRLSQLLRLEHSHTFLPSPPSTASFSFYSSLFPSDQKTRLFLSSLLLRQLYGQVEASLLSLRTVRESLIRLGVGLRRKNQKEWERVCLRQWSLRREEEREQEWEREKSGRGEGGSTFSIDTPSRFSSFYPKPFPSLSSPSSSPFYPSSSAPPPFSPLTTSSSSSSSSSHSFLNSPLSLSSPLIHHNPNLRLKEEDDEDDRLYTSLLSPSKPSLSSQLKSQQQQKNPKRKEEEEEEEEDGDEDDSDEDDEGEEDERDDRIQFLEEQKRLRNQQTQSQPRSLNSKAFQKEKEREKEREREKQYGRGVQITPLDELFDPKSPSIPTPPPAPAPTPASPSQYASPPSSPPNSPTTSLFLSIHSASSSSSASLSTPTKSNPSTQSPNKQKKKTVQKPKSSSSSSLIHTPSTSLLSHSVGSGFSLEDLEELEKDFQLHMQSAEEKFNEIFSS